MDAIDISVVLPLYRTAATLEELHRRLTAVLAGRTERYELILVDDGCPAGSGAVAARLAAGDGHVRHLTNERNRGQQWTVFRGVGEARGAVVAILDADLQDPPEQLPVLLDTLAEGRAEAVFAARQGQYQRWTRMVTSRVFKGLLQVWLGVPRGAGSYVVMTRRMADRVLRMRVRSPYMLALLGGSGLPLGAVPMERPRRPEGDSAYSTWRRVRFAANAILAAGEVRWRNQDR